MITWEIIFDFPPVRHDRWSDFAAKMAAGPQGDNIPAGLRFFCPFEIVKGNGSSPVNSTAGGQIAAIKAVSPPASRATGRPISIPIQDCRIWNP